MQKVNPSVLCAALGLMFCAAAAKGEAYSVGVDDALLMRSAQVKELDEKRFTVSKDGFLDFPVVGKIHAAGLQIPELCAEIEKLFGRYYYEPRVSLEIVEYRSQPVSVLGAVTTPGVVQLRGRKTLYEVLSMAGGPRETAGSSVAITRPVENGPVPLPGAATDPTGRFSTAEVSVREIVEGKNPAANIEIKPNDVVSVSQGNAKLVYVVGDVQRAGAFALGGQRTVSVLGALSMAGGLGRTANSDKARIFREVPGQAEPQQIAVNITRIMAGKAENIGMRPDDVLVIPTSGRKSFTTYVVPAVIAAAVAAAIYAAAY